MQTLAGDRVVEGEAAGVQRRPADEGLLFGPVEKVAGQRMAQPGHMYPDLVGASGSGRMWSRLRPWRPPSAR